MKNFKIESIQIGKWNTHDIRDHYFEVSICEKFRILDINLGPDNTVFLLCKVPLINHFINNSKTITMIKFTLWISNFPIWHPPEKYNVYVKSVRHQYSGADIAIFRESSIAYLFEMD